MQRGGAFPGCEFDGQGGIIYILDTRWLAPGCVEVGLPRTPFSQHGEGAVSGRPGRGPADPDRPENSPLMHAVRERACVSGRLTPTPGEGFRRAAAASCASAQASSSRVRAPGPVSGDLVARHMAALSLRRVFASLYLSFRRQGAKGAKSDDAWRAESAPWRRMPSMRRRRFREAVASPFS